MQFAYVMKHRYTWQIILHELGNWCTDAGGVVEERRVLPKPWLGPAEGYSIC